MKWPHYDCGCNTVCISNDKSQMSDIKYDPCVCVCVCQDQKIYGNNCVIVCFLRRLFHSVKPDLFGRPRWSDATLCIHQFMSTISIYVDKIHRFYAPVHLKTYKFVYDFHVRWTWKIAWSVVTAYAPTHSEQFH